MIWDPETMTLSVEGIQIKLEVKADSVSVGTRVPELEPTEDVTDENGFRWVHWDRKAAE